MRTSSGTFSRRSFPHVEHAGAESHGMELGLMLFSVLVALAGIRLAYSLYVKNTSLPGPHR